MATTMERPQPVPVHRRPRRQAPWPVQFYRSGVGKKWVMAITGIVWMGFIFGHAFGNLKVYFGAEDFNHYGEFLREMLVPLLPRTWFLWLLRAVVGLSLVLHVHAALSLTKMNQEARAGGYQQSRDWQAATAASRSMRIGGVVIALFILWHLADLTWGTVNPDFVRGDVYRNFVATFERPAVSAIYIVANIALGFHLFHGAWSIFQTTGVNNPKYNAWRKNFAIGFATLVAVVNISFPVAVLTGIVSADDNPDCVVDGDVIVTCMAYEDGGH